MPKDLSGQQTGMSPANSVNNPRPDNRRGRNDFPQTFYHLTTDRYGEFSPFFYCKAERGDVQNLQPSHDLHTFTLKSPMVSDVSMTKSFVKVNMECIYPRNWEKMHTIPTQGDDIPADSRALLHFRALVEKLVEYVNDPAGTNGSRYIKSLLILELLGSHGSLFERFNIHPQVTFKTEADGVISVDKFFDKYVWPSVLDYGKEHYILNDDPSLATRYLVADPSNSEFTYAPYSRVSARRFIELIRRNSVTYSSDWLDLSANIPSFELASCINTNSQSLDPYENYINIEPIIAYQLACAQFGTNDHVDFIYSAQLYRDNMQSLYYNGVGEFPTFFYNGTVYQYDVFSAQCFDSIINVYIESDDCLDYFINLFSYQNSLRFGDYFTGGRPRPLAVGEFSAEVTDNSVSAVDVTRSIQMQRLLNRVNMVGRKLGDYLSGIFGGPLPEAPLDVPVFLAHQHFKIDGFTVNNTGDAQFNEDVENITTSALRTVENRFAYEIEIDRPCFIIGMNSYESTRIYSKTVDRFAFHHDRYDDFIPEMQYIGDQEIKRTELDSIESNAPYAYCLRYMEYKQRYSYASGGFIENLPSWAFVTDNADGNPPDFFINPDYIRSSPSEFDRFYKSLNGYSLGTYFHFIVSHTNITSPSRMMEYTPEILR